MTTPVSCVLDDASYSGPGLNLDIHAFHVNSIAVYCEWLHRNTHTHNESVDAFTTQLIIPPLHSLSETQTHTHTHTSTIQASESTVAVHTKLRGGFTRMLQYRFPALCPCTVCKPDSCMLVFCSQLVSDLATGNVLSHSRKPSRVMLPGSFPIGGRETFFLLAFMSSGRSSDRADCSESGELRKKRS